MDMARLTKLGLSIEFCPRVSLYISFSLLKEFKRPGGGGIRVSCLKGGFKLIWVPLLKNLPNQEYDD